MRDCRICFDGDVDLRALFQLHLVAIVIDEAIWNANLAIQVVRAFYGDLGFFRFTAAGVGMDDLLHFSR